MNGWAVGGEGKEAGVGTRQITQTLMGSVSLLKRCGHPQTGEAILVMIM